MAVAVIIARGGTGAKSRLAGLLGPDKRARLAEAMVADMIFATRSAPSISRVLVITPTPSIAELAGACGAEAALESEPAGINAAFQRAKRECAQDNPDTVVLFLPGDLPTLTPDDVEIALAAAGENTLALAPAMTDRGTGAVALRAGAPFSFSFGENSFKRHLEAAQRAGLTAKIVATPGFGLDLDRPGDIDRVLARPCGRRTRALLANASPSKGAAA